MHLSSRCRDGLEPVIQWLWVIECQTLIISLSSSGHLVTMTHVYAGQGKSYMSTAAVNNRVCFPITGNAFCLERPFLFWAQHLNCRTLFENAGGTNPSLCARPLKSRLLSGFCKWEPLFHTHQRSEPAVVLRHPQYAHCLFNLDAVRILLCHASLHGGLKNIHSKFKSGSISLYFDII